MTDVILESAAGVVTAIGVFLVLAQLRSAQRARRREFEDFYVRRYWTLMDRFSPGCALRVSNCREEIPEADRAVVVSYLRLCEDELDVRLRGWVTDETWAVWSAAILTSLERWPYQPIWNDVQRAFDGEFVLLRQFQATQADPSTRSALQSWLRGLKGLTDR